MTLDPSETCMGLSADGVLSAWPGGEAFWSQDEATLNQRCASWLISEFEFAENWPNWEMHPEGDELVYLLSGAATLILETADGPQRLALAGRAAVRVPRGVWHTAEVTAPCRMLFITWGAGTQHRPVNLAGPVPVSPEAPQRVEAHAVSLREITANTARAITALAVAPGQRGFVASNAESLAEALFSQDAWYRAIYWGEQPVGFVMLADESLRAIPPAEPAVGVWRLMVDARFQGRGIGRTALQLVIAHLREQGCCAALTLSYVPGPGCPEPFYRSLGFVPTGRMDGDEVEMVLPF